MINFFFLLVIVEYCGLIVVEIEIFRNEFKEVGVFVKVYKNRLTGFFTAIKVDLTRNKTIYKEPLLKYLSGGFFMKEQYLKFCNLSSKAWFVL